MGEADIVKSTAERILTTHAGSLPRPPALKALWGDLFRGRAVDRGALSAHAEAATRDAVARQIETGIDIINNGEQARESFFTYVQHRLSGFGDKTVRAPMGDMARYPGYLERMAHASHQKGAVNLARAPAAIGAVHYVDSEPARTECESFRKLLAQHQGAYVDAFITAASPGIIAAAMENRHYADRDAYLEALGQALQHEYELIVDAGFILQIDAPDLAMERHCAFCHEPLEAFLGFAADVVETINRATAQLPRDRIRLHVCWGNYEGPHDLDVALEEIWHVIANINAGAVLLSMANPRHAHEYRAFNALKLPSAMQIIAGVIDTTTNYIEHPEVVADRLERLATAVGDPHRILASPDCGFETAAGFQSVADDIVWRKLDSLCAGAQLASSRLF
ncbi:MAG: cobalamin-independent methionine synthase II family protein [Gammaproteobacteria bacterium]|nr:cobalamin-independent methionine synthase II family protein [Gammaproteobacteria bacterium]